MVDSAPPDEGCEVLDGDDEERDKNDKRNVAESDDPTFR